MPVEKFTGVHEDPFESYRDDPAIHAVPERMTRANIPRPEALLPPREQAFIYAMTLAKNPARVLEIGVCHGGTSRLFHWALEDLGRPLPEGVHVGIDPEPKITVEWEELTRCHLMVGTSPAKLPEAVEAAGGLFDLVFVDGDHSPEGVARDLAGLCDVTAPGAWILCHDWYNQWVAEGIRLALARGLPLAETGIVTQTENRGWYRPTQSEVSWGGIGILRRSSDA